MHRKNGYFTTHCYRYKPDPIQGDWDKSIILFELLFIELQTRPDSRGLRRIKESVYAFGYRGSYKPDPIQGDWDLYHIYSSFSFLLLLQTRPDSRGLRLTCIKFLFSSL